MDLNVQRGDSKTSFCNFSDYIGFSHLPDSCPQFANCQAISAGLWILLPEAIQTYLSLCPLLPPLDSDSNEMPCQRALVLASEKLLKVLDGANKQCWVTTYVANFDQWEVRDGREVGK